MNKIGKVLMIVTIFVGIISTSNNDVKAAQFTKSELLDYTYKIKSQNTPVNKVSKIYIDDNLGFCVDPGVNLQYNAIYSEVPVNTNQLKMANKIAYYGYLKQGLTDINYAFTQVAIWNYISTGDYLSDEYYFDTLTTEETAAYNQWKNNLVGGIGSYSQMPSFTGESFEVNVGETLTLVDENNVEGITDFEVTLSDPNDPQPEIAGEENTNNRDKDKDKDKDKADSLTFEQEGNKYSISGFTEDMIDMEMTLSFAKEFDSYNAIPIVYSNPTSQDILKFGDVPVIQGQAKANVSTNDINVNLTKLDNMGNPIAGAKFKVSENSDFSNSIEVTTDANGQISSVYSLQNSSTKLYAQEVFVPAGYVLDSTVQEVDISNYSVNFAFTNNIVTSTVNFSKVDSATNKLIPGAQITMEKWNDSTGTWELYENFTSEASVKIFANLQYGKYRFTEVKAPAGYVLNKTPLEFSVQTNGEIINVVLSNEKVPETLPDGGMSNILLLPMLLMFALGLLKLTTLKYYKS